RLNVARVSVSDGRARSAVTELRSIAQQADSQGQKYVSVNASVLLAETLVTNKDISAARPELEKTLGRSEKLGLRLENARIQYLLGKALRLSGNSADSAIHYREAARLLGELAKEPGAERLAERYDLKPIEEESTTFAK